MVRQQLRVVLHVFAVAVVVSITPHTLVSSNQVPAALLIASLLSAP